MNYLALSVFIRGVGGLLLCASALQFVCLLFALRNRSINFRVGFIRNAPLFFASICPLCASTTAQELFSLSFLSFFFSSSLPLTSSLPFSFCLYTALNCCGGIKNSGRLDRFEYKFLKNGTTWNAFVISQELSTLRILKARSRREIFSNSSIIFFNRKESFHPSFFK